MSKIVDLIEVEKGVYEPEKKYHFGFDFTCCVYAYLDEKGKLRLKEMPNEPKKN
jgi:hypothetical protein